jgi:hypothetical protein
MQSVMGSKPVDLQNIFLKFANMRRRPGISGLQNVVVALDKYRELGENVATIWKDFMKEQLATFREQLEEFARKHKVCR